MPQISISRERFCIGAPLEFDVLDKHGRLLLQRGLILCSERQLDALLERGAYGEIADLEQADRRKMRDGDSDPDSQARERRKLQHVSVFGLVDALRTGLESALAEEGAGQVAQGDFQSRVLELAALVARACELDTDTALACILVNKNARYSVRHAVNSAILTEVLLTAANKDAGERASVVAAALTMNLSISNLQDELYERRNMVEAEQQAIRAHPVASANMLRERGVSDPVWLDTVVSHHEKLDGSGYPAGLSGAGLSPGTQIVSLADSYCAAVSERAYREGVAADAALKCLHKLYDPALVAQLEQAIGTYPPGTFVNLENGDIAIALKRTLHSSQPVVRVVFGRAGRPREGYPKRRTGKFPFRVAGAVSPKSYLGEYDLMQLWDIASSDGESGGEPVVFEAINRCAPKAKMPQN